MALALANVRFWPTVAPLVGVQFKKWEQRARAIEHPALQALALAKLREEKFNAEVAATLATLAPREHRGVVVEAIVAYEVMYDYLDGLTEPRQSILCALATISTGRSRTRSPSMPSPPMTTTSPTIDRRTTVATSETWSRSSAELLASLPSAGVVSRPLSERRHVAPRRRYVPIRFNASEPHSLKSGR